jgi:SPX domain protein involved in polyphosphate accumulation
MAEDRMQLQRFELKYRIRHEDMALSVRDFVSSYLEVDEYGATLPRFSYPVHSLYLDSPNLRLYWDTINGSKNRFKLRLRFYENRPDAPVYFEIKRRMNNIIAKQRGGVRREAVDLLLAGHLPEPGHLVSRDPKHLAALEAFCRLATSLEARPRTHVAYYREAWLSPSDNAVRVTLDRDVRTERETTARLTTRMHQPVRVFGSDIILELKFTNRFPNWFGDLVRHFGLMQCGAAKYVDGVSQLGVGGVKRAFEVEQS